MFRTKLSELVEDLGRVDGPALDELIIEALRRSKNGLSALADRLAEPGAAGERVGASVRRQAARVVETIASLPEKIQKAPEADLVLATCGAEALAERAGAHLAAGKKDSASYLVGRARTLFPEFPPVVWLEARLAEAQGDQGAALTAAREAARAGGANSSEDHLFWTALELGAGGSELDAGAAVTRLLQSETAEENERLAALLGEMLYGALARGAGPASWGAAEAVVAAGKAWPEAVAGATVTAARRAAEAEIHDLAAALTPYRQAADFLAEANAQVLDDLVPEESLAQSLAEPAEASHRALLLLAKALRSYEAPGAYAPFQVRLALLAALAAARGPQAAFTEVTAGDALVTSGREDSAAKDSNSSPAGPTVWGDAERAVAGIELLLRWGAGEHTVPVPQVGPDEGPRGTVEVRAAVSRNGLSLVVYLPHTSPPDELRDPLLWRAVLRMLAGAGGHVERAGAPLVQVSFHPAGVGRGLDAAEETSAASPGPSGKAWLTRVEEGAVQAFDQTLGDLARVLAYALHDIKNNFVFLRDWAEELAAGKAPRTRVHRRLAEHIGRLQRWTESVDGYLALSGPPHLVPMPPGELLDEVKRTFEPILAARGALLRVEPATGIPPVMADRDRVLSALANLIKNAGEVVGSDGGSVGLDASYDRGTGLVCFRVTDSGPGLSKDTGEEKGGRGVEKPADETLFAAPGMGLGLISARRVAEEHGGKLTAENAETEDGGTKGKSGAVFRFYLPAHDPERELHLTVEGFDWLPGPARQALRTAEALLEGAGGAGKAPTRPDAAAQLSAAAFLYLKSVETALAELVRPVIRPHAVLPSLLQLFDHRRGKLTPAGSEALTQLARVTGMETGPGLVRKAETVLKHMADEQVAKAMGDNLGAAMVLGFFARDYRAGGQTLTASIDVGAADTLEIARTLVFLDSAACLAAAGARPDEASPTKVSGVRRNALQLLGALLRTLPRP